MINALLMKALWPFFNELLFKNKTFIRFVKANSLVLILLFLNIITGISCIYMFRVIQHLDEREDETEKVLDRMNIHVANQGRELMNLNARYQVINSQRLQTIDENNTLKDKVELYENWLNRCGISLIGDVDQVLSCNQRQNRTTSQTGRQTARSILERNN